MTTRDSAVKRAKQRARPRLLFVGAYPPVEIGTRAVSEDVADRLTAAGWTVKLTSRRRRREARVLELLTTVWRSRHDYDIAHVDVYSGAAFRWAEAVGWQLHRMGKPFVLTLHGGNLPIFATKTPRRVARLLARATAVTTPSSYIAEPFRAIREGIHLIPNPLEIGAYSFRRRIHAQPRIMWLRAFHELYAPELAPRVLAALTPAFPDSRLTMIGPDKDGSLGRTRELAARIGVLDRITWIAGIPKADVPRHLALGDIFLNTTTIDNTPVSVLEAMASGLCVVSSNVGGIPFLLEHDHDALLVESGDADAMANAIKAILLEPDLAARLSSNARQKALGYDWSVVLPQWEQLFAGL